MWICDVCSAETEDDSWELCWNCSSKRHLTPQEIEKAKNDFNALHKQKQEEARIKKCVRCKAGLEFLGTKKLHEGTKWGFWFGNLGELFVKQVALDQFYCPECGKVEFFLENVEKP